MKNKRGWFYILYLIYFYVFTTLFHRDIEPNFILIKAMLFTRNSSFVYPTMSYFNSILNVLYTIKWLLKKNITLRLSD